ncbi:hypothetical protein CJ030_MR7G016689 [Morella rubra]|uniref:Reverse transcriptase zinc-binding domain-containing protein n=1 Tax=Morella rubra TaxID=262757 RepID=A0A6A1UX95_9ROSI|nr:hypothetical protein CJ030_MR7G016689 [Morella rubra]
MNPPRPWVKCLRAKYLKNSEFMRVERKASSFWIWQGILKSRLSISQGRCFLVGTGENNRTWVDPWVPNLSSFLPQPRGRLHRLNSALMVSHFVNASSRPWNVILLNNTFDNSLVDSILQIYIPRPGVDNKEEWTPDSKGDFTVKSAYRQISSERSSSLSIGPPIDWKKLWGLYMHERSKLLLWKVA